MFLPLSFIQQESLTNGLILDLNTLFPSSFQSGSNQWVNLVNRSITGSLMNGVQYDPTEGGSLIFDGTDDYVNIPFTKPATCTFSIWAKTTENGTMGDMLFNAGPSGVGPNLYFSGDNKISWNTWDSSNNFLSFIDDVLTPNTWHNYVVTNVENQYVKLYIDGLYINQATYRSAASTDQLTIGGNINTYMWKGNIAQFQIYNRELTPNEIKINYNKYLKRFDKTFPFNALALATPTEYSNAYEILQANPSASSGIYSIKNPNINNGEPFPIYADMETDGGGWTLIVYNETYLGWNTLKTLSFNESNPTTNVNYSILEYADALKITGSGFQYMIEANERGRWGGIWTANQNYSFTSSLNTNTDITLDTKFDTWNYTNSGIEERMPYYTPGVSHGLLTTSQSPTSNWWGTLIAGPSGVSYTTAPWIQSGMPSPNKIWYWVR